MSLLTIVIVIGIVIVTGFIGYRIFVWLFWTYIIGSFADRGDLMKLRPDDLSKTGYFATSSTEQLTGDLLKQREILEQTRAKVRDLQTPRNIILSIAAKVMLRTYTAQQTVLEKNTDNIEIMLRERLK